MTDISAILSRDTSGLTERFDECAIARATVIQQIDQAMDVQGVEKVLTWVRNLAHARGYTVNVEMISPGRISDPRR